MTYQGQTNANLMTGQNFLALVDVSDWGLRRVGELARPVAIVVSRDGSGHVASVGGMLSAHLEPMNWFHAYRREADDNGADPERATLSVQLVTELGGENLYKEEKDKEGAVGDAGNLHTNKSTPIVLSNTEGRPRLRGDLHDLVTVAYSRPDGGSRAMIWMGGDLDALHQVTREARMVVPFAQGTIIRNTSTGPFMNTGGVQGPLAIIPQSTVAQATPFAVNKHTGGMLNDGNSVGYLAQTIRLNPEDAVGVTLDGKPITPPNLFATVHFEDDFEHGPIEHKPRMDPPTYMGKGTWYRGQICWMPGGPPPASGILSVAYKIPDLTDKVEEEPPPPPESHRQPRATPPSGTVTISGGQNECPPEVSDQVRKEDPYDPMPTPPGAELPAYRNPNTGAPSPAYDDGMPASGGGDPGGGGGGGTPPGGDPPPGGTQGGGSVSHGDEQEPPVPDGVSRPAGPQDRNLRGVDEPIDMAGGLGDPADEAGDGEGGLPDPDEGGSGQTGGTDGAGGGSSDGSGGIGIAGRPPVKDGIDEVPPAKPGKGYPCCFSLRHPLVDPSDGGPIQVPDDIPCPKADKLREKLDKAQAEQDAAQKAYDDAINAARDKFAKEAGYDSYGAMDEALNRARDDLDALDAEEKYWQAQLDSVDKLAKNDPYLLEQLNRQAQAEGRHVVKRMMFLPEYEVQGGYLSYARMARLRRDEARRQKKEADRRYGQLIGTREGTSKEDVKNRAENDEDARWKRRFLNRAKAKTDDIRFKYQTALEDCKREWLKSHPMRTGSPIGTLIRSSHSIPIKLASGHTVGLEALGPCCSYKISEEIPGALEKVIIQPPNVKKAIELINEEIERLKQVNEANPPPPPMPWEMPLPNSLKPMSDEERHRRIQLELRRQEFARKNREYAESYRANKALRDQAIQKLLEVAEEIKRWETDGDPAIIKRLKGMAQFFADTADAAEEIQRQSDPYLR